MFASLRRGADFGYCVFKVRLGDTADHWDSSCSSVNHDREQAPAGALVERCHFPSRSQRKEAMDATGDYALHEPPNPRLIHRSVFQQRRSQCRYDPPKPTNLEHLP